MLNFLLDASSSLPVGYKKIGIGEAAHDALHGFIVVFIGIAFLVGLLWLIGFAVRKINSAPAKKKEEKAAEKLRQTNCPRKRLRSSPPRSWRTMRKKIQSANLR